MRVEPVGSFAALTFHALAHVPIVDASSLFEPRYVAWCAHAMTHDAREPLASDGPAIGAQLDAQSARRLAWLPLLHTDVVAFDRTSARDLAELGVEDVSDVDALRALQTGPREGLEWLRADLLLASRAFAAEHASVEANLRDACDAIAALLSGVRSDSCPAEVRVAWAIGARGRGFRSQVIVGAAAPWSGLDAATPAAIALHEHAVLSHSFGHDQREWMALCSVARALETGPDTLRRAHSSWLASLDLTELANAAIARGAVSRSTSEALLESPADRATLLARLSPG